MPEQQDAWLLLRRVSHQIEYKNRGVQYHPSKPGTTQSNPTGRLRSKLGLTSPSRVDWVADDRLEKGVLETQHVKSPVLQLCVGGEPLRSGVADAATLLAKAMAETKETSRLDNRIVKDN